MTELAALVRCFEYDRWANQRACDALAAACLDAGGIADDRPLAVPATCVGAAQQLGHVLLVDKLWMEHLRGSHFDLAELFPTWTAAHCADMADMLGQLWPTQIAMLANRLDQPILYPAPDGAMLEASPRAILAHVLHHGSHHRAIFCERLQQAGFDVPPFDYLAFDQNLPLPRRSRRSRRPGPSSVPI